MISSVGLWSIVIGSFGLRSFLGQGLEVKVSFCQVKSKTKTRKGSVLQRAIWPNLSLWQMHLSLDTEILFRAIILPMTLHINDLCTKLFIAALLFIVVDWKQITYWRTGQLWFIHMLRDYVNKSRFSVCWYGRLWSYITKGKSHLLSICLSTYLPTAVWQCMCIYTLILFLKKGKKKYMYSWGNIGRI